MFIFEFLRNELPLLLEDVPLASIRSMISQHEDWKLPRYTREVKHFLNQTYSCWIGDDKVHEQPRTSESLDFFLWRHIKQYFKYYTLEAKDYGGIRDIKKRYQLTFYSDIINSSSKLMYASTRRTCNSVLYCSIAIESSNMEQKINYQ